MWKPSVEGHTLSSADQSKHTPVLPVFKTVHLSHTTSAGGEQGLIRQKIDAI